MIPISHICKDFGEKSAYADYGYIGKELRLLLIQEEVPWTILYRFKSPHKNPAKNINNKKTWKNTMIGIRSTNFLIRDTTRYHRTMKYLVTRLRHYLDMFFSLAKIGSRKGLMIIANTQVALAQVCRPSRAHCRHTQAHASSRQAHGCCVECPTPWIFH